MDAIENDIIWHDIFYTEMTTGLRRGELCGLKWIDFDETEGALKINRSISHDRKGGIVEGETKTGQGKRTTLLPLSTVNLLKERKYKSCSEWIFEHPLDPSRSIAPCSVYNKMKAILKSADLPSIRFHDLRHTFATTALANGMDVKTLSTIIGHVSSQTTAPRTSKHQTKTQTSRVSQNLKRYKAKYERQVRDVCIK